MRCMNRAPQEHDVRSRYVFHLYAMLVSCQHPRIHQSIIRASVATATFTWVLRVDKITPCLLYIRSARLLVYQPRTSRHPGDTHPSDTEWAYSPLTIFQSRHSPLTIFTIRAYSLALRGGITSGSYAYVPVRRSYG